jgi:hypothetical protein
VKQVTASLVESCYAGLVARSPRTRVKEATMAEPDHARKPDEELTDRGDELSEEDLALVAGGGTKGTATQGGDEN